MRVWRGSAGPPTSACAGESSRRQRATRSSSRRWWRWWSTAATSPSSRRQSTRCWQLDQLPPGSASCWSGPRSRAQVFHWGALRAPTRRARALDASKHSSRSSSCSTRDHIRGAGRFRLPPPPHPRCRLRGATEANPRRAAPALRALARRAWRRPGARGARRLSPRAELSVRGRARRRGRARAGRGQAGGRPADGRATCLRPRRYGRSCRPPAPGGGPARDRSAPQAGASARAGRAFGSPATRTMPRRCCARRSKRQRRPAIAACCY